MRPPGAVGSPTPPDQSARHKSARPFSLQASTTAPRPIPPARIDWQKDGTPYTADYADVYYSSQYEPNHAEVSGAAEIERVFLTPAGFSQLADGRPVTVGELGFGTGLNFLVTAEWALAHGCRLHFVSFEGHPLAPWDWEIATEKRKSHFSLAEPLRQQAPPLLTGWHQRRFADGAITLSVYHGEVARGLATLAREPAAFVDVWFLDGFAPDRNPAMWTPSVMNLVGKTTRPGGNVATFTAAGRVRRALTEAGFVMRRVDQRPFKHESLAGVKTGPSPLRAGPEQARVHGAGIAGASMARHLAEAGLRVEVWDPALRQTIRQAVLHPRLLGDGTASGAYRVGAFHYATHYLAQFKGFIRSEVLQVVSDQASPNKFRTLCDFYAADSPEQAWLQALSPEAATDRAGVAITHPALHFRQGAQIDLEIMCRALLDHPNITLHASQAAIDPLMPNFLCTGLAVKHSPGLDWLELDGVAGRLHEIHHSNAHLNLPVVGKGYAVPVPFGTVIGSTYEYTPWSDDAARTHNIQSNKGYLGQDFEVKGQQVGTRAVSSDRNPVVGRLDDHLWVSTGHGSMGTSSAPYAAAILTQALLGGVPVATEDELMMLAPQRFKDRQARRGPLNR